MIDNRRYRVLHIFSSYGGGISSLILSLCENKNDEFEFDIMAFSYKNGEDFLQRIRKAGVDVFQMPRPRIEGYSKFKKYIDEILTCKQYDAIHCHITGIHAKPFMNAAKKHGIRNFVLHAHTTSYDSRIDQLPPVNHYNKYLNFHNSTLYMTCSDLASEYIFGKKYITKREPYLIPNGINEELFQERIKDSDKDSYRDEFNINEHTFVIGHVGRFTKAKNHTFIIDIVKKLKEKNLDFVLVFVGSGELFEDVKQKVEIEGIENNIRFTGRRTDISQLMQFFDCMILPSVFEGLPTVAVECQAAGTHMLLSDIITHQCDMNLDLVTFLPIDNTEWWVNEIIKTVKRGHRKNKECLAQIRRNGFTAYEAGKRYCNILKQFIEGNA